MPFWNYALLAIYLLLVPYTAVRILLDTRSTPKALGYLLVVLIFPIVGSIIYFSFGINYRHRNSRFRMARAQTELDAEMGLVSSSVDSHTVSWVDGSYDRLVDFIGHVSGELPSDAAFKLLINGETKFPEVLQSMERASAFIHMEYYAWENDVRGNQIKDMLLRKAAEGVKVRALFDDYASRRIKRNIVRELEAGGVAIYPRIRVRIGRLANRLNHRDHRKLIIIDGNVGFVGGINISDRYDNSIDTGLYWRDTHVKISGKLVGSLQRHFIISWNTSQSEKLHYGPALFPVVAPSTDGVLAQGQVVAGGPIYALPGIMLTYMQVFALARRTLYITNPYFIPSEAIIESLKQAAISGVDVRLLLPLRSDSFVVEAAAKFYFPELMRAGVRIYLYRKGFVHAKTAVVDAQVCVIGTANMDIRSFDLNFEIMTVVYGREMGEQLESVFMEDTRESIEITRDEISNTSFILRLWYATARLVSSFL